MSNYPEDLRYAKSHEWVRVDEPGTVTVGISDHAQGALGDIVFVETPELNQPVAAGDEVAVVESVKSAADIYSPVSGTVVAVNEALADAPGAVNTAPYDDGWLYRVALSKPEEVDDLLTAEDYAAQCEAG